MAWLSFLFIFFYIYIDLYIRVFIFAVKAISCVVNTLKALIMTYVYQILCTLGMLSFYFVSTHNTIHKGNFMFAAFEEHEQISVNVY